MFADIVFSLNISVKTKNKVFVVRDEVPHFLFFSEALSFCLPSLLVNPALSRAKQ